MSTAGSLIPREVTEGWERARQLVMTLPRDVRETMCFRAQGLKSKAVARRLNVCVRTIENRSRVFANALANAMGKSEEVVSPVFPILVRAVLHTSYANAQEMVPTPSDKAERELEEVWGAAAEVMQVFSLPVRQIVELRQRGKSYAHISRRLGTSLRTIENTMRKFRQKLARILMDVETQVQAVWLEYALYLQMVLSET